MNIDDAKAERFLLAQADILKLIDGHFHALMEESKKTHTAIEGLIKVVDGLIGAIEAERSRKRLIKF